MDDLHEITFCKKEFFEKNNYIEDCTYPECHEVMGCGEDMDNMFLVSSEELPETLKRLASDNRFDMSEKLADYLYSLEGK